MATQDSTYSTNVRFPGEMQEQMKQAAEEQRRSINGLIVRAVEIYLQEHDRRRVLQTPKRRNDEH